MTGHRVALAVMLAVAGWLFYRVVRRELTGAKVRVLGELNRDIARAYDHE